MTLGGSRASSSRRSGRPPRARRQPAKKRFEEGPSVQGREWQSIELLRRALAGTTSKARLRPLLGIGDDAAVLEGRGTTLVWTIDGSVEGVHFVRHWLSLQDIGWRATHAAVSDVAAMGARPVAALCHLVLPSDLTSSELRRLGEGQAAAARELACPVLGGNVSSGPQLELATTVLGELPDRRRALTRSGARPGDEIWVVGQLGFAAAGLRALEQGRALRGALAACGRAWRRPRALIDEGLRLQGRATACIDVSDGLVGDATHVARASGVALVFDRGLIEAVCEPLRRAADQLGVDVLELVLFGGEDYALLATGPSKKRPPFAQPIGRIEVGEGVWLAEAESRRPLRGGFQHLR